MTVTSRLSQSTCRHHHLFLLSFSNHQDGIISTACNRSYCDISFLRATYCCSVKGLVLKPYMYRDFLRGILTFGGLYIIIISRLSSLLASPLYHVNPFLQRSERKSPPRRGNCPTLANLFLRHISSSPPSSLSLLQHY